MSLDRCLRTIIEETGTHLPKEDVANIMEMLIEYDLHPRNRQVFGPFSAEQGQVQAQLEAPQTQRLLEARDTMIARARLVAAQQRANVIADAAKRGERTLTYRAAPEAHLGLQAKLVGTNTPFLGNRDSAAAAMEGNMHSLFGAFDRELKANGLDRVFASRALETEWARELHELNRTNGGQPGITGNRQALQIAQAIHNLQRASVEMVNREGAFIGSYDGYITKTSHSADLLQRMGEDAWVSLAGQHFDLATIYPNRDPAFIDRALRDQYKRIASGLHDSYDPAELDLITYAPGQNLARRVSESRVIHFKSADDWLAYMQHASELTPTQVVFFSAQKAARDAGLMRIWGTNPKRALETDFLMELQRARDANDYPTLQRLNEQKRNYDLWMSYLTGEANAIKNRTWALITQNVLTVQRLAKLGFLPFAQLTDLASVTGELRYQGVGFLDRMTAGTMAYFRGGMNSEKRQVADLLNAYIEGELSQYGTLMETNDPRISGNLTGRLNAIQEWFFRYTGATAMTNRARGSVMYMMSRHMGQYHGQAWTALGAPERRIMRAFGIDEHEWNALSQANWTTGLQGNRYLTPRDADTIPHSAIDAYNLATGQTHEYQEFREDMARRLYAYYADRMNYGVLNPGIADRAILYRGAAADTALGMATRIAFQFKSFMVTQMRRTWGRELYGGQGTWGAISGLTQFAVFGTVLGLVSNSLNQLFKGQNPFSQWEEFAPQAVVAGFTRAGAASIVGDYLFSDFNRHGGSVASYILGPTIGSVEAFSKAYSQMVRGENPSGNILRFAQSVTPLVNSFYTKMAFDFLVWNGLIELANPGYNRRLERNLKKNQGIEFLKKPIDFSPSQFRAF